MLRHVELIFVIVLKPQQLASIAGIPLDTPVLYTLCYRALFTITFYTVRLD